MAASISIPTGKRKGIGREKRKKKPHAIDAMAAALLVVMAMAAAESGERVAGAARFAGAKLLESAAAYDEQDDLNLGGESAGAAAAHAAIAGGRGRGSGSEGAGQGDDPEDGEESAAAADSAEHRSIDSHGNSSRFSRRSSNSSRLKKEKEKKKNGSRALFPSAFANVWAPGHQSVSEDLRSVSITLDKRSGSGFRSKSPYLYGYFSAAIKLPGSINTAGVAITFYMSNSDLYPKNHDEIDFEFLGVVPGEPVVVQTNVYGNGSTSIGREQRYHLWFDPTAGFHRYSILWTPNHTVFSIDGIPIRELKSSSQLGAHYPSKPMSVYATIWDASSWATEGGKYKVNYTYAPFVASYTDFELHGCRQQQSSEEDEEEALGSEDDSQEESESEEEEEQDPSSSSPSSSPSSTSARFDDDRTQQARQLEQAGSEEEQEQAQEQEESEEHPAESNRSRDDAEPADDYDDGDYEIDDYMRPRFVCSIGNGSESSSSSSSSASSSASSASSSSSSSSSYPFPDPFLSLEDESSLRWVQQNYMVYDYCADSRRYPQPLPECT